MSTAIAQRPVTTSNMIGGQTHSQKQQRRQISKRQQQQQRKSYEHNKNTRIDSNPRITKITTNNNNTSSINNNNNNNNTTTLLVHKNNDDLKLNTNTNIKNNNNNNNKHVMKILKNLTEKTNDEAIKQIIKEVKILEPSNSYPNIVNFYVVTSALSKCLLLLQNTDLGLIPSYLKNNFAERSIINEKIARQVNDFNQYVAEKEKVPKNMNTTNFVISRRHSRLLNKLDVDLLNEKQKDSLRGINLESKQPTKKQELENPLAEATSQIIIDALSETDDLTKVGANIYKYLEKCGQTPQNLFDSLFVLQKKPRFLALLGICDQIGLGTSLNEKQAFESYERAAEGGDDLGQYLLALCYFYERGTQQNFEKSFEWFAKSAESGNVFAQSALGLCYFKGCGTAKDERKAFYWYSQSVINSKRTIKSQTLDDEQTRLKVNARYGCGTTRDQEKVFYLHHSMAKKGGADAQCALGYVYQKGVGVPQDLVISFYWYNKSAQAGSIYGQYNLACCYEYGFGTEKNLKQAIHWYQEALKNGYEDASKPLEKLLAQKAAKCVIL